MNCRDCIEVLAVADPNVIALAIGRPAARIPDGLAVVDLRDHLRACDSCRRSAQRVLEEQAELAAHLDALRPIRPLSDAVSEARREVVRRRIRRRRQTWAIAAAAVAGVLGIRALDPGIEAGTGAGTAGARHADEQPIGTEVDALLDESVVVMETANEDVVVFWFYQGRGE